MLELHYTKSSDNYILINTKKKLYAVVAVKYRTKDQLEDLLGLKVVQIHPDMKAFKASMKGYK